MDNDVNNEQAVTAPDANNEQVVIAQGEVADPTTQQGEVEAQNQEQAVPYDRFKEVNDAKKAAEEKAAYAQRQLELMQQNAQAQQPVQQAQQKTTSEMALDACGLQVDDLYGENIIKYQNKKDQIDNALRQQSQVLMSTQQFAMSHPDINEVVGSVNLTTGQIVAPTQELMALVAKKPYLAQASTADIYQAVLEEREVNTLRQNTGSMQEHQTRQGVDTKTMPLGGSAAGGGGSGMQGSQGLLTREQSQQIEVDLRAGKYA